MSMKASFESIIRNGKYDLAVITDRINYYHAIGDLNDEEREELIGKAQHGANYAEGVELLQKITELDTRVHALESEIALIKANQGSQGTQEGQDAPSPDEYVPGKWYYNGDKVSFEGKVYTCIAPDGVVCVWSPSAYPAYWQEG